jgi:hypothetical protein
MASLLHDVFNELKAVENVDLLALPNAKKVVSCELAFFSY